MYSVFDWKKLEDHYAANNADYLGGITTILNAQIRKDDARPAVVEKRRGMMFKNWVADANAIISEYGYRPIEIKDGCAMLEEMDSEEIFQIYALRTFKRNRKNGIWRSSLALKPGQLCFAVDDSAREWPHDYEIDPTRDITREANTKVLYIGGFEYHVVNVLEEASVETKKADLHNLWTQTPNGTLQRYRMKDPTPVWNSRLRRQLGASTFEDARRLFEGQMFEGHARHYGFMRPPLTHIENIHYAMFGDFTPKDEHVEELAKMQREQAAYHDVIKRREEEQLAKLFDQEVDAIIELTSRRERYENDEEAAIF